jgi:hypothetical protein
VGGVIIGLRTRCERRRGGGKGVGYVFLELYGGGGGNIS